METNTLTPALADKVFNNELIREKILGYVFSLNSSGKILVNEDILTCRLVNHAWLDYITLRLQASGFSEYTLLIRYVSDGHQSTNKYKVHKFFDTWVAYPGAESRVPLFKMEVLPYLNSMEFCVQNLVKCLTLCGNSLHHLYLNLALEYDDDKIVANCTNYVNATGELNLPNLTELKVVLPDYEKNKPLASLLLSRVLSGCKQLTFLSLAGKHTDPSGWSRLFLEEEILSGKSEQLPNTLVKLEIGVGITMELFEKLLLENSLPKLSWLKVKLDYSVRVDNNALSRIIHRYSRQLNYIFLDGGLGSHLAANRVLFPVMTKLKDMYIFNLQFEREPKVKQSFPMLQTLTLEGQTPAMMQPWIQNPPFGCVKEFTVNLCENRINVHDIFTLDQSRQLHVAFPNVQKLEINFGRMCRSEDGNIQNIFQYMPQLRDLTLRLHIYDHPHEAFTWDAILLGVTPEYAKTLAESPREEWDSIDLSHHRNASRSIVNLAGLKKFRLVDAAGLFNWEVVNNVLLISDISFWFAFLRMPTLETLTLDGAFGATQEMVSKWRRPGRTFYGRYKGEDGM